MSLKNGIGSIYGHRIAPNAKLSGVDLNCCVLIGAKLNDADLSKANLSGAKLMGADLSGADLRGAQLERSNLTGAKLDGAKLLGANFNFARLEAEHVPLIQEAQRQMINTLRVNLSDGEIDSWGTYEDALASRKTTPRRRKRTSNPYGGGTLPAGRYYVGDPCYLFGGRKRDKDHLFKGDDWSDICESTDSFDSSEDGIFTWRGIHFFASSTAFGDGTYTGTDSAKRGQYLSYSVDAGLIGCWPLPEGTSESVLRAIKKEGLGHIKEFQNDFVCRTLNKKGDIIIGTITIKTGDDEDTDYENDY
jgi:hypothetical protein